MDLLNQIVIHKAFGEGTVIKQNENYITVSFNIGEKMFAFPTAFDGFLQAKDKAISNQIKTMLDEFVTAEQSKEQEKKKEQELKFHRESEGGTNKFLKRKNNTHPRANIAFKCNFCDGGQSKYQVGFNGVCSEELIYNNIEVEHRTWCNSDDCPCLHYHNGEITRDELEARCEDGGFVCYESQMLRDWKALAGIVEHGENKGKRMKLKQVQSNSLCVLTTRDPKGIEEQRYVFAAFLVDDTYEGDGYEEGYVSTNSEYKIKLSHEEAHKMLFWNYHSNNNNADAAAWNSGLHRYFEDLEGAQILRDIAKVKKETPDEELAERFYQHFCKINGVDISSIGDLKGALKFKK